MYKKFIIALFVLTNSFYNGVKAQNSSKYPLILDMVHHNKGDLAAVQKWIKVYDVAWADYNKLPEQFESVATLYTQDYNRYISKNANRKVNELRQK